MKRLPAICLLCLTLLTGQAPAAEMLDRIVAVVNDDVVLASELEEQFQLAMARLSQRSNQLPPEDVLKRQVLEQLINERLQLSIAERTGIKVDDQTLDNAVRRIAENNNLSLGEFRDTLEREGMNMASFREGLRKQIIVTRLRQRQVEGRVNVSPAEIDEYLASQADADRSSEYLLGHILIAAPEGATAEELRSAREEAEAVMARLQEGGDFAALAAEFSDSGSALEGGSLGWRAGNEVPSLFAGVVPDMSTGDIRGPIQNASGFHIVKLIDQRSGERVMVDQVRARHILIVPDKVVSDQDAQLRLETLRRRIRNGEDFGELASAHSADTGSASDGGELGWRDPNEFVPAFREVVQQLPVGEVSEPFQSNFGWHIVEVLERREHDGTEQVRRREAAEAIRERKTNEAMEEWLRRMRDQAYVDIRLES